MLKAGTTMKWYQETLWDEGESDLSNFGKRPIRSTWLVFGFVILFVFHFVFEFDSLFITWGSGFSARGERPSWEGGGPEQIDAINCKSEPKWNHFCRQNLRHCQFELLDPKHMRLWYKFQIRFDSQSENVNFKWWRSANFQLEGFNKSHFGKLQFTVGVFAGTF